MDFLDFITKPPNFYEWLKFNKISGSIPEEKPYLLLPKSCNDFPLSAETTISIPSIGESEADFVANVFETKNFNQLINGVDGIIIDSSAGIVSPSIADLNEWSCEVDITGFSLPTETPVTGLDIVCSNNNKMQVYFNIQDNRLVYLPQRNNNNMIAYTDGYYAYHTEMNFYTERIYLNDVNAAYLNDGNKHSIQFGKKGNYLYYYFDNIPICRQNYDGVNTPINEINIGTYYKSGGYSNYNAPKTTYNKFAIHDSFIFNIPN